MTAGMRPWRDRIVVVNVVSVQGKADSAAPVGRGMVGAGAVVAEAGAAVVVTVQVKGENAAVEMTMTVSGVGGA
jgi:hypothetical protein